VLNNWSVVRSGKGHTQKTVFFNRGNLDPDDGRHPGGTSALGIPVRDVESMRAHLESHDTSLNAPLKSVPDGDLVLQDLIVDPAPSPEEMVLAAKQEDRRRAQLAGALETLSDRERFIIVKRWQEEERISLRDVGTILGVSPERVRQIESTAFTKLRRTVAQSSTSP
jgi:RNA polymerase sigma-32 factor